MISVDWIAGVIAFLFVLASTPIVWAISRRWNLYDSPGPLKIHDGRISRLGGVSIAFGLIVAIAIEGRSSTNLLAFWFAAFGVIWLAGLIDDTRGLSPILRLSAQMVSGTLLWLGGWRLPGHVPGFFGVIAICAIVVLFVNAFNFLDGSDGLVAGVTAIISVAYVCAYGNGNMHIGPALAWSLLGASLGFLAYNFPPARIFMGDSGSTTLGFCVAFLGIDFVSRFPAQSSAAKWTFPVLVAAVPLIDGIVVVLRRIKRGTSPLQGDRCHFYDLLLARGWRPRAVAFVTYAATALLAATGFWILSGNVRAANVFLAVGALGLFLAGVDQFTPTSDRHRRGSEQAET
jgi:UDP-GlcNAc:undecaprenyl-phosphate/decaprenyl-phosphate GlcNAc-1-phosphate transferase